ncbi:MAG: gluconolactonase [Myxacorys chilensis ATA2-1-KO14]|nr:gluconolactonase [Myxacorys chilensis ATA2-1-KO14]
MTSQLPAIFEHIPEAIIPAQTIAKFPVNTFLENIAIDIEGNIFITSYEEGKIYRLTPNGEQSEFAQIEGNVAGIAIDRTGDLIVAGSTKGKTPTIFRVDSTGMVESLVTIPEAIFLNGMTPLKDQHYLVADSYKGAIWDINIAAKTAQVWIEDDCLARSDTSNPFPAVNGIKIYNNSLFASNTQRQHLIRIPMSEDGIPGTPEVFLTDVNLDDFAFDVHGNLYGTTHVYNSVIRISPDKQITTIAKAEQGMTGSTALSFGYGDSPRNGKAERTSVYVVTNGGMSLPPSTGVQAAQVVRLDLGVEGLEV